MHIERVVLRYTERKIRLYIHIVTHSNDSDGCYVVKKIPHHRKSCYAKKEVLKLGLYR